MHLLMRVATSIFIILLIVSSVVLGQSSNEENSIDDNVPVYKYTPIVNETTLTESSRYEDIVGVHLIKWERFPIVNRRVRFISLDTNIILFSGNSAFYETKSQTNGTAFADMFTIANGNAKILIEILSSKYEYIVSSKVVSVEVVSIKKKLFFASIVFLSFILICLFLVILARTFYNKDSGIITKISNTAIGSLFNFSLDKNHIAFSIAGLLIVCLLVFFILLNPSNYIFIVVGLILSSVLIIFKDKRLSLFFLFIALFSESYILSSFMVGDTTYLLKDLYPFLSYMKILIPAFVLITIITNGSYISLALLSFQVAIFGFDMKLVITSLIAIFISGVLYTLLKTFNINIPILYKLNLLIPIREEGEL